LLLNRKKEVVLREQVEVREKAPSPVEQTTVPPAQISSTVLRALPLLEEKFQAALPLVPGVIRTPDGKINIKGVPEGQGLLPVDSAELVDPVTGSFSIDIPVDAVESLRVYKSAYRAEYGRFSGGLTSVETKPPSDQFRFEVNDFLPTVRVKSGAIVGIADDQPRVYLTGPVLAKKLDFSEALAYDLVKQPVRGLAWPHNETKTEGFNSFTSFQYILSPRQLLTTHVDFFPLRQQFVNINSLLPQSASSDYGQKGFAAGTTYRTLFPSGGILTTLVQFMRFDSNSHGQGPEDMRVAPSGFGGNYFNVWQRQSSQAEILETYDWAPKEWKGQHDFKAGVNFLRRSFTGTSLSHPALLLREDGSLAERIDFLNPGLLKVTDNEVALFFEDHWTFSPRLAADAGLHFSTQNVGEPAAIAPRFGLVYSPGQKGKTIFLAGTGVFYERVPLLAGDFTANPTRAVTLFDPQGDAEGPPLVYRNAYIKVDEEGRRFIPSKNRLDSTPYNVTWNVEADHELFPHLLLRLSCLSSRTLNQFIVNPLTPAGGEATLLLSNTGGSRYHEFESTVRLRPSEKFDLNFSYVTSHARGDLNVLSTIYVPFEEPVIRPNLFGTLPSNVPNRFVSWGRAELPWEVTISPVLDIHSGFPYSAVDARQNYVGAPNGLRLPAFASLDLRLSKDFRLPVVPWLNNHKLRMGFAVFNVTDHANPRDVYNNVTSPLFGNFLGFQHRFYDASFDVVY